MARANWFIYVVRVAADVDRDALMRFLAMRGIETRAYFPAIHCNRSTGGSLALSRAHFPSARERPQRRWRCHSSTT